MKTLQKSTWATVFLIVIFMSLAVLKYENDGISVLPQQLTFNLYDNWTMTQIDSADLSDADLQKPDFIKALVQQALSAQSGQNVSMPYTGMDHAALTVFQYTIPKEYAGMTLRFTSTDSFVWLFLDGAMIYQHELPEDTSEPVLKTTEHVTGFPNTFQDGDLWIVLASPSSDTPVVLEHIQAETDSPLIVNVFDSITNIGCCLLIILTALVMLVLAVIRRYTQYPARGEVYLGLAGLTCGIYCFIETDTLYMQYNLVKAYAMEEYLALLLPLFLALYFERNLRTVYPRRFFALVFYTILNALVQILLELTGIQKLQNMTAASAAAVGIVCITAVISLIQYDRQHSPYQTLSTILSMLVLLAGSIAKIGMDILFQTGLGYTVSQYSMTLFSSVMVVIHILQLSREYRANAEESARLANEAKQEALAANEAKGKFLAHMSHEIRTPINAVLGMDEMILRESTEPQIKEYAMDIYTAGQTLLSLINDILDFSKIESGKMEIVPVEYDISSMIHDLANMATQRASDKDIQLEITADPAIPSRLYGDDVRIRQILSNILTNAVKYTPKGTVWLRVTCRCTADTAVLTFEVEDTGIGIREEDLPNLYAEFQRIEEDRNRNIEGTGLGMSITLQLLQLLGSSLQVESTYGKGSRFSFELEQKIIDQTPIGDFETRVQQMAGTYSYRTKCCAPNAAILVVDDNAVNRKVLRNLLKETRIQVTDADGGAKCLELVQENHYDLILLDHMMPEMDGIETLHRLKALSNFPCQNTPVVVLTANAVSGAKEKYLQEGFDDFLSKPVVPDKLEKMIRKLLPDALFIEAEDHSPAPAFSKEASADSDYVETLPAIDGLDWHYAWLHLPDPALLEYTVREFYAQINPAADQLEQFFPALAEPGQLEQYRIQVHAMKSLAATIGIVPLCGMAKILEYAARDGKIEIIASMNTIFLEEWRSYNQKLTGLFGLGTTPKKTVTDPSLLLAQIEMLRFCMQQMDIDQADQLSRQLQEYTYPEEIDQNIQKLAQAVTNLDSEETDRLADLLLGQLQG